MASVKWSTDSLKDLKEIDRIIGGRIVEKVIWFEQNFSAVVLEPLRHDFKGLYKLRVGDYRAVYSIHGDIITIEMVRHRCEAYK